MAPSFRAIAAYTALADVRAGACETISRDLKPLLDTSTDNLWEELKALRARVSTEVRRVRTFLYLDNLNWDIRVASSI